MVYTQKKGLIQGQTGKPTVTLFICKLQAFIENKPLRKQGGFLRVKTSSADN